MILTILNAVFSRNLHRHKSGTRNSRIISILVSTIVFPVIKVSKIGWEKENFLAKKSTGIGMKVCKRKHRFIKNNISGYVNPSGRDI